MLCSVLEIIFVTLSFLFWFLSALFLIELRLLITPIGLFNFFFAGLDSRTGRGALDATVSYNVSDLHHDNRLNKVVSVKITRGVWCLTPLSTISQLYRGSQFY